VIDRRGFLAFAALVACRRARTDATPRIAKRVVSTSASTTEALFAVGAGALVVGRSRYCDYPPEVTKLPSIGGYVDPSLEAILGLQPDLVVGARGPIGQGLVRTLEERGIATWFPETETLDQILAMIEGIGARTAHDAAPVARAMRERRAAIAAALASAKRPRTLLVFEKKPISVAGPGSFPDEMLRLAGGDNALSEGARYATISLEKAIALDPDVILDAEMGAAPTPFDSTWSALRAVREGKIVRLGDERVLRPGPRVLDGVALIARALHPGVAIL
jgi:iron complex transport system substrate-binding protein